MQEKANPTTFRPNSSDVEMIEKLRSVHGIVSDTDILRMGLRAAVREAEAIPAALELVGKKSKGRTGASAPRAVPSERSRK
jgi:hypothetical protein